VKSEELRRYEEEFRAMREMLGTYYLELGGPVLKPDDSAGEVELEDGVGPLDTDQPPDRDPDPPLPKP
jgi:hypothetical protein